MNLIKAATLAALLFLLSTQIATAQTAAKNDSKATTFSSGGNIEIPEEIKIKLEQELIRRGYNPVTTREKFARLFRTRPVGDDRHDANMTGLAERSGSFDGIAASVSGGPDAQLTSTGLITGGVKAHAVMKDGVGPAKIYDIALYPIILSNGGSVFTMKVFASDNGRLLLQVEFLYDNMKIIYLDRSCKVRNYQEASIPEQEQVERQQIRLGIFPASNITIDFETGVGFFPWGGFMADWVRTQPAR